MNSNVISGGIELVNKSRVAQVEADAAALIKQIIDQKASIDSRRVSIKLEQDCLVALGNEILTQRGVLGTEWTGDLNMNQVTILKSIEALNKAKQGVVDLKSQGHTNNIIKQLDAIKGHEKVIAELQEKLGKLAVEVVTPSTVLG
jgi:hypothetical protein